MNLRIVLLNVLLIACVVAVGIGINCGSAGQLTNAWNKHMYQHGRSVHANNVFVGTEIESPVYKS